MTLRTAATSLFSVIVFVVLAMTTGLISANVRKLADRHGWDNLLIRAAEQLRWERIRGLWWLWSISGLSGGLALALWLSPFLEEQRPTVAPPFTPAWLTLNRQDTFKSGVRSIINAAGNLPPTKIETVAEPQSDDFARELVNMFILSGFQPHDFGQGDYVGTPTTHRLATGITVVAPVPSLAAEALRVGLERIGIQTRRSDHSRTDDYLVVEVGRAP